MLLYPKFTSPIRLQSLLFILFFQQPKVPNVLPKMIIFQHEIQVFPTQIGFILQLSPLNSLLYISSFVIKN